MFKSVSLHWLMDYQLTGRDRHTDRRTQPFIVKDSVIFFSPSCISVNDEQKGLQIRDIASRMEFFDDV